MAYNDSVTLRNANPFPHGGDPVAVPPTPKAPAMTVEQQVAQIQKKLVERTIGSDRDTHRNDNPQWEEEKP